MLCTLPCAVLHRPAVLPSDAHKGGVKNDDEMTEPAPAEQNAGAEILLKVQETESILETLNTFCLRL